MALFPRRFRRAKAELNVEAECTTPPDESSGGVVRVRASLLPGESLTIEGGWLELSVITTRFSRTVLDGYLEHSTERPLRVVELSGCSEARAGSELEWSADVPLPLDRSWEGRPTRLQWKVHVRFVVNGYREIRATTTISPLGSSGNQGPIVDGTGFLPLYEFRAGEDR